MTAVYQSVNESTFERPFFAARGVFFLRQIDAAALLALSGSVTTRLQIWRSTMAKVSLSRRRTKRRHVREKATIDHLVRTVFDRSGTRTVHAPVTLTGLSVEEQVRKVWHPCMVGLAVF
jgi:hypothetical protein